MKNCWKVVESVENFVENFSTQNYLLSHPTYYRIRYDISLCQLRHIPISAASKQCVSLSSRHNIRTGQTRNVTLYICQQCITIDTHSKAGAWIDYILLPFPVNIKTYFYVKVNILCEILFFIHINIITYLISKINIHCTIFREFVAQLSAGLFI